MVRAMVVLARAEEAVTEVGEVGIRRSRRRIQVILAIPDRRGVLGTVVILEVMVGMAAMEVMEVTEVVGVVIELRNIFHVLIRDILAKTYWQLAATLLILERLNG